MESVKNKQHDSMLLYTPIQQESFYLQFEDWISIKYQINGKMW